MEMLLTALLSLWGAVSGSYSELTMEQMLQAYTQYAQVIQQAEQAGQSSSQGALIKQDPQRNEAPVVKGVYVTAHSAAGARMETLLKLLDELISH